MNTASKVPPAMSRSSAAMRSACDVKAEPRTGQRVPTPCSICARCCRLLVRRYTSPTSASARAIAKPVLPVNTFPQSRTRSIISRVLPAVTRKRGAGAVIGSSAPGWTSSFGTERRDALLDPLQRVVVLLPVLEVRAAARVLVLLHERRLHLSEQLQVLLGRELLDLLAVVAQRFGVLVLHV